MKVIIAGTCTITNAEAAVQAVAHSGLWITEVVSGGARCVDVPGELWAARYNIPAKRLPADRNRVGKSVVPARNRDLAEYADALIAAYDGQSPGTRNVIDTTKAMNLTVCVSQVWGSDPMLSLPENL